MARFDSRTVGAHGPLRALFVSARGAAYDEIGFTILRMRSLTTAVFLSLVLCPGPVRGQPNSQARAAVGEHLRRGDLQNAEATCRDWLESHPDDATMIHMLGVIRLSLAERVEQGAPGETHTALITEARELLERAESLSPDRALPDIDHALGFIYLTEGRLTQAKKRLDRAIASQPRRAKLYMLRGQVELQLHLTAAAEADLRQAGELDASLFEAHILHATALFRLGRAAEANELLERIYASLQDQVPDQRHWRLLYDLSRYAGNDLERARGHLEKARAIAPGRALTRGQLGVVYYQLGRLEEAKSELDFVLSRSGVSKQVLVEALHYRGLIAKHSREFEASRDYLDRALSLAPTRSESLKAYSSVLLHLGEEERAARARERFREIVEIENEVKRLTDRLLVQPRQPGLRVHLIRLLIRLDRAEEARAELARFQRQFPSNPNIEDLEGALSREG